MTGHIQNVLSCPVQSGVAQRKQGVVGGFRYVNTLMITALRKHQVWFVTGHFIYDFLTGHLKNVSCQMSCQTVKPLFRWFGSN